TSVPVRLLLQRGLTCARIVDTTRPVDGTAERSRPRRPSGRERRDARTRSGGSLEARGQRRCPLRGDTTSLRRMRLRRPSQIAPSPNLLRAIVLARGNLIPIFVHAAGGRKSTPSIDRRSKPLLEFEPSSN